MSSLQQEYARQLQIDHGITVSSDGVRVTAVSKCGKYVSVVLRAPNETTDAAACRAIEEVYDASNQT